MSYTYNIGNEADFAKARIEDVNASYKDLTEVCHNIRRRPAEMAVEILEDAKAKKRPIRYRSHNTRMAHRKELQGQKGRWPVKCVGIVLKCLESAIANAKEKGLSEDLIVIHASANKKYSHMRYSSKGRRNTSKLETARVEIVLKEKVEGKKKRIEQEAKAAEDKKKVDAAKKAEEAKKAAEAKAAPKAEAKEIKPAPEKAAAAPKPVATPVEKKAEPAKPVEKPVEKPKEVPKAEAPKPVEKVEAPKPAEKPKEAPKTEAPKVEAKPAPVKEEPKKEEKPPEKKAEPPKEEPKKEAPKTSEKNEVA
ncbi:MAG: 50S ribosomal protein L22 [bacterium]|nr:50S ribosomal protein L22 [bacterium]